jgi:hypothetical protein
MQTGEMQRGFEAQTRQMRIDLEHERAQKRSASLLCVGCERHCVPSLALRTVRCGGRMKAGMAWRRLCSVTELRAADAERLLGAKMVPC